MANNDLIIVTGGIGFIGTNLVLALNKLGYTNIVLVDHLDDDRKKLNINLLSYKSYFEREEFLSELSNNPQKYMSSKAIIHLGACSNTTEADESFLINNNTEYSKKLFSFCEKNQIQFIYASSAATYGDGSKGYNDDERDLNPLNFYGYSKYLFDEWVLNSKVKPIQYVGLKFFNVYGPYEWHKDRMASVVFHGYKEILKDKKIHLFKSHKDGYKDGEQKRDFIYVKDVVSVILYFLQHAEKSGIFNVGTGEARSFYDLAVATFAAIKREPHIEFVSMPTDLREKYQYFTQANINKLRNTGYTRTFFSLEEGVKDYVQNYLLKLTV